MRDAGHLRRAFEDRFGGLPVAIARAPGRVNLIGEHTDYNDGFVLPMAIDRHVRIALRPRSDRRVRAASLDFGETVEVDLDTLRRDGPGWSEYLKGVAWALHDAGEQPSGWDGVISGDVPIGAGLASSAALEMASARAFCAAAAIPWDAERMAQLAQRAENEWVGVRCGIMDQLVSASAVPGCALLVDCRSLETRVVPLPPQAAVVILDSGTRRDLAGSAYNDRREECRQAALRLGVPALRDTTVQALEAAQPALDEALLRRARHVVTENARTVAAAEALGAGDASRVGRLMSESHRSLRDDFEVSTPLLDELVARVSAIPGCLGARMTGAGFGGCVVALVKTDAVGALEALGARAYVCRAAGGAELAAVD